MPDRQLGGERSPSLLRLLTVTALACLLPVAALGVAGLATDDEDDVTAAGRAAASAADSGASSLPPTTVPPPTTAGPPGGDAAEDPPASSTTTTTTTAPAASAPTTTAPAPATTAAPAPVTLSAAQAAVDRVVDLVNAERAAANPACAPLSVDARLATAAQGHSDDMAARDYFDHTSPDGTTAQDRAEAEGFTGLVGENIAWGYSTPEAVMAAWMGSSGHRRNILDCGYTVIGMGLHQDGWYWTQMFGTPS